MEKKYPIGGYAPGNYHNRCCTCDRSFFGDKRATQCEDCAVNYLREKLKPYEPATPQGIGWVKAKERLPEQTETPVLYIVKWFDIQMWVKTWTANQLADWVKNTPTLEYYWLDESQPQAGREGAFAEWAATLFKFTDGMWEDDDGIYYSTDQLNDIYQRHIEAEKLRKQGVKHPDPHVCDNRQNCTYPKCGCLPF